MTITHDIPKGVNADGKLTAWLVKASAVANPTTLTATALSGADAISIGCYLTEQPNVDVSTETRTIDRVCLPQVLEGRGASTWTVDAIRYIYDVQNAGSDSNKVYEFAVEGEDYLLVLRYLIDSNVEPTAAQVVDIFPVELGPQVKLPLTRNTEAQVKQAVWVNGPVVRDHTLA